MVADSSLPRGIGITCDMNYYYIRCELKKSIIMCIQKYSIINQLNQQLISFQYFSMPQATILILDNSNYSINGDYQPTRWIAQIDAAGLLIQTKMQQSHENFMGIILSGGKQIETVCTLTNSMSTVSACLYGIKLHGAQRLSNALQTSALALKHRANQNLSQKIICFIASTVNQNIEELKIICKKFKKNNISLDIVAIGDLSATQRQKLQIMHQTVKGQVNACQLLFVDTQHNVSDTIFSSRIVNVEQIGNMQMMNQENDPQLMMALQLSLQQQQQRIASQTAVRQNLGAVANQEQQLQQQALQLSLQQHNKDKKEQKKQEDKQ